MRTKRTTIAESIRLVRTRDPRAARVCCRDHLLRALCRHVRAIPIPDGLPLSHDRIDTVLASVLTVLLVRFGLLSFFAHVSGVFCYNLPVTLRGDAWYAVHAYAVAALMLGVAVVAYRIACAGQPLLKVETAPSRPLA